MRRVTGAFTTVALSALVALLSANVALADEAVVDGDGLTPISTNALAFGNVCANSTVTKDVLLAVTRSTSGAPNTYKSSSTGSVSVGTVSGAGLSAVVPSPAPPGNPSTITFPSNWSTSPIGTVSPSVTSRVSFVASAAPASLSGSVGYTISGTASNNTSLVRSSTLPVTATVVSCDTTPPTLNLPSAITTEAVDATGATATYTATATDADPASPAVTCTPASGTTFALGTTVVSCSATDAAGNTASGSFAITVQDTTGPVLTGTPSNVTIEATSADGATVTYTDPTATDAVDGSRPATCVPASGSVLPLGASTIACSSSDTRGNSSSSTFVVTVADSTGPSLTLPGNTTAEATGAEGAAVSFTASATDAVDGPVATSCVPSSGSAFALATTSVDCGATDSHGNSTSGSFDVTVVDTTAPALTLPASFSSEATGAAGAAVSFSASALDVVDGVVGVTCNPAPGTMLPLGATTVTCTSFDSRGNTSSASFVITVVDTTAPVLSLPADITVEADGPAGHVVGFSATATDLVDGTVAVSCTPPSGSAFPVAVTAVACVATDANDNSAEGEFTVTVTDTTAPVLTVSDDITTEATGPAGADVTFDASADDVVDGEVAVDCSPSSGSTFPLGTTTVDCSATDAAGNEATDSFTVTVVDTTPPAIEGTPSDFQLEAEGSAGATGTYTSPSAADIVDGEVAVTCTPPSGSSFALDETTTVNCSAADAAGNTATSSFTVHVSDGTAPALSLPSDITEEAAGPSGAVVTFAPTASDLVDGIVDVTCLPPSGSTFGLDTTAVQCSATDAHGNSAAGSFNVTVVDTTAPDLTMPADITAEATGPTGATMTYTASASDLVDGSVSVTCLPPASSTFALGSTTVACSSTDAHGNTATGSFTITVVDTTAPDLTLPADITAEATGPGGASVTYLASASDAVDGAVTPVCLSAPGPFVLGATIVNCTATDAHGNSASGSFAITVVDTTPPALSLPSPLLEEATGPAGAAVTFSASGLDVVDGSLAVSCTPSSASTFALGATTVNCHATDAAGNTATGSFTVTVVDTTEPSIAGTPTDVVQEATSASGAVVTYTPPTADDIVDGLVAISCVPESGSTFPLDATTTVTCTAADAAGNVASSSFTVKVADTSGPLLSLPSPIVAEATGPDGAVVPFAPSASDAVDGAVPVSCSPSSGSLFALGLTSVACTASDAHANASGGSFTVTVVDTTAPDLALPAAITAEATGPSGAVVTFSATASDAVDGPLTPACTPASGATFAIGTTTVSCVASDGHGNTTTGSFTVTVQDTTKPHLTLPEPLSAIAIGASGAPVSYVATASDVVDGSVPVSCVPGSASMFAPGLHVVSCYATDSHGNTGTGQFTVTVLFDVGSGLVSPVNPAALNIVKNGSTVPLKWQIRTPSGGYVTSTSIVSSFVLTQLSCSSLTTVVDEVDFTTTGGTSLRYDTTANQFIQNWQTPKKPGTCYRVDVVFVGGLQKLSAVFQLK